jgi:7-cyano-7-deazaguanine synthase
MARRDGYSARALTIEIRGTANSELRAARLLGRRVGVLEHRFVRMPDMREAGDISGSKVLARKSVPATYIPMKNAIYYFLAAAFAEEKGADCIIGGQNADDRRLFEDTGEEFFASLQKAIGYASPRLRGRGLRILRPLRDKSKGEVVALAAGMGVPLELTWSCHRSGGQHCWKCDGCRMRLEAFRAAGVEDPLRR